MLRSSLAGLAHFIHLCVYIQACLSKLDDDDDDNENRCLETVICRPR